MAVTALFVADWIRAIWARFLGCLGGLVGKAFHFRRDHGKALSRVPGTRRSRTTTFSRRWRKPHLVVDVGTQEIAAVEPPPDDVGDVSALPDLLDQIESPIGSVTADGAYDGDTVYDEVPQRHPAARVIVPLDRQPS